MGRAFRIEYTPEAVAHLGRLTAHQAKTVLDAVQRELRHQPTVPSRSRKPLRANPVAPWELRVGALRVYFDITVEPPVVTVRAVGVRVRERVWIAGKEVDLG